MFFIGKYLAYRREATRVRALAGSGLRELDLARDYLPWRRALIKPRTPLELRRPWITFAAARFLERQLKRGDRVFEWGGGGSTLFFAERAQEVVTVENDPEWATLLKKALAAEGRQKVALHHVSPDATPVSSAGSPGDPDLYRTAAETLPGRTFRDYASFIDRFPDGHFNGALVDGRARPSCLKHALPKLAPGGWLCLDNAERERYQPMQEVLAQAGWAVHDFYGPGPSLFNFWLTRVWQKPS